MNRDSLQVLRSLHDAVDESFEEFKKEVAVYGNVKEVKSQKSQYLALVLIDGLGLVQITRYKHGNGITVDVHVFNGMKDSRNRQDTCWADGTMASAITKVKKEVDQRVKDGDFLLITDRKDYGKTPYKKPQ